MSVTPSATSSEKARTVAEHEERPQPEGAAALTVRRWRMTPEGRWWLITGALLWAIGVYRGINLLTFVGILLAVAWAGNAWSARRRRLRNLRVRRWFGGPAFAGEPVSVGLELSNSGDATERGIRLHDAGPDHDASFFAVQLRGGQRRVWRHELTVSRRGRYEMAPLEASSGHPFGLAERVVAAGKGDSLVVFPRLLRLHAGRLRRFMGEATPGAGRPRGRPQPHPAAQTEFHGLRPFRIGDSSRLIHWRTSARRNALMVREFEDMPSDNLILVVDPWLPAAVVLHNGNIADDDRLSALERLRELTLSLAATICHDRCRQTGDELVFALAGTEPVILQGTTGPSLALQVLEALALVNNLAETDAGDLAHRLGSIPLPPGPVLAVSAMPSSLASTLEQRLHRPVAALDPLKAHEYELVEKELLDAP